MNTFDRLHESRSQVSAHDDEERLRQDVHRGLSATPKRLPSKYFYDARGSELFEQICDLPEYYLTRTEIAILEDCAEDIAAAVGPHSMIIEYGSGSGIKTDILLGALSEPVAYAPVEISESALNASVATLGKKFPAIEMMPVCGDFNVPIDFTEPGKPANSRLIFFPGSTIGNLETSQAVSLLKVMHSEIGTTGAALIGIDLKKDKAELEAAYNDSAGVTAEFTLNLLHRLNRELSTDFVVNQFAHQARYNAEAGRIETHIVSRADQTVRVGKDEPEYQFSENESMLVEYSCKYSLDEFSAMAGQADMSIDRTWTDRDARFALVLLRQSRDTA